MARDVQVLHEGEIVAGRELEFTPKGEIAGEFTCEDGSVVRLRTVINKIVRLNDRRNAAGEPIFLVNLMTAVNTTAT